MRYIRFLKCPKLLSAGKERSSVITALITITSDLGESFCSKDVTVAASLVRDEDGESMGCEVYQWRAGMRNLQVSISANNIATCPVKLHVAAQEYENGDDIREYLNSAGIDIVSAWSETLDRTTKGNTGSTVERRFLSPSGKTLTVCEETGESIARHIWDAGLMLMSFLDVSITAGSIDMTSLRETLAIAKQRRLNCIELGAGCGVVGLGLAQALSNCDMLLTDLPEANDVVTWNMLAARPASNTIINFEVLNWEEDLPILVSSKEFDLILVADCTYNPTSIPSLVRVLATLTARSPKAVILLAQKVRHSSEAIFFEHIAEVGLVQNDHVVIRLPSNEDPRFSDHSESVDIYIFQARNSGASLRI